VLTYLRTLPGHGVRCSPNPESRGTHPARMAAGKSGRGCL